MDIRGLRTLNEIGTILFGLIGFLIAGSRLMFSLLPHGDPICMTLSIVWVCIILIFTISFYNYTVLGLDRGNYNAAKTWTLIGAIVGLAGGILPFIIFLISYVSFDDAIRAHQYGPRQYGYPPYPIPIRYCIKCKRQIPPDSRLCPFCGAHQDSMDQPINKAPQPILKKSTPNKNQNHKPLPPPPKSYKKKNKL